uniref:Scaffold protein involved in DNA repair n=1 Tax=Tetraodon nigroviridis TaxID=99883 RepID=H3CSW3_TETNG
SQAGESRRQSVSSWVRSAQALLQTPPRTTDGQPKTPDDSGKKKPKFQSGGLAERLSRLQSRQRSAVSFWRHQSLSDASAATADRPGVLVLEVLEVLEECSMRVARCERHRPGGDDSQSEAKARALVLFSRETVAHLMPAPRDIIHIYPPWQSLSIEGFRSSVILNTHLSQKVHSAPKAASSAESSVVSVCAVQRTVSGTVRTLPSDRPEINIKIALHAPCSISWYRLKKTTEEGPGTLARLSLSLLEVVEGLGQAGSVGQDVEVVVQRVYGAAVADASALSFLKPRVQSGTPCPHPTEKGKTRLCALVQDSYGMFSVVQLHLLPHSDDLHRYGHMWQGRTCLLRGVKVVQRVTRARCSRLFSLIDSLWPPAMPLGDHRHPPSTPSESRAAGPAPSFCYLLSGEERSVQPAEGSPPSPLYLPPTLQTLRAILQTELKSFRCSFVATVIYKRFMQPQIQALMFHQCQGELWLVLSDPSLQQDQPERPRRRTLALCVSASCLLTSSVVRALESPAGCRMSFRDVVREHGRSLLCPAALRGLIIDRSLISFTSGWSPAEPPALPQPVRLDPLSPEMTPNSLCSLSGVIVGVDEDTAYSWPVCSRCRSDNLELLPRRNDSFHCGSCESVVDKPDTRIQLEVYLSSSFGDCTLKVKLQQKTIESILNAAALEGDQFTGYDVESVLGKEVGPLAVYVRAVSRTASLRMGLEEVSL